MPAFTHFDANGHAAMGDVSQKGKTERRAVAEGRIRMCHEYYEAVRRGSVQKGDVLGVARIAGIIAVKLTGALIPLCHSVLIEQACIDFEFPDRTVL